MVWLPWLKHYISTIPSHHYFLFILAFSMRFLKLALPFSMSPRGFPQSPGPACVPESRFRLPIQHRISIISFILDFYFGERYQKKKKKGRGTSRKKNMKEMEEAEGKRQRQACHVRASVLSWAMDLSTTGGYAYLLPHEQVKIFISARFFSFFLSLSFAPAQSKHACRQDPYAFAKHSVTARCYLIMRKRMNCKFELKYILLLLCVVACRYFTSSYFLAVVAVGCCCCWLLGFLSFLSFFVLFFGFVFLAGLCEPQFARHTPIGDSIYALKRIG